jgi:RNA recognition motif. (a.k.a. RRM, RBD, or RNP domain)
MLFTLDGIPRSATSQDLNNILRTVARVEWLVVVCDPQGRSLRFAIGRAADRPNAIKIEAMDGNAFRGRTVRAALIDESVLNRVPRIRELVAVKDKELKLGV